MTLFKLNETFFVNLLTKVYKPFIICLTTNYNTGRKQNEETTIIKSNKYSIL